MTTWRERIAAARERGAFTDTDRDDIGHSSKTCMVGDVIRRTFGEYRAVLFHDPRFARLYALGYEDVPGCCPVRHVRSNEFDAADKDLDQIEDEALRIKRESA